MGRVPKIPPVETPPFDGTRCPPLLTGAGRKFRPRRTGRGYADGHPLRAGPYGAAVPHEHTARTHRSEVHISTPRRRQRRALSRHDSDTRALLAARSSDVLQRRVSDDQGGRGWRASLRDMRCSEYSMHADLVRVLLAVHVVQENCGVLARQDARERLRLLVHVRRARDARLHHHVLQIRQHEVDERLHCTCAACRTCTCSPSRRVSTPPGAASDSMTQGPA